eukprot:TRINITY_DN2866_c0_g1::TRINITY_DN2866_c0_g1_i2::g.5913::m.5913 TRINITY_DN2866_c0_g1::TRINITY_DN2866_c0_g1_i2::g.5913  ORF type:complete len:742 (-),score=123.10,sp/Q5UQX5/YR883_MIMIV/25.25/6e-08,Ank_2/PF12796.2/5.5e-07,Ank_2/PF12796.2/7.3e-07,Ank_4/PF13637.1/1e-06,Ank_4/PF13637.1/8.5e-05,Ank_5/PF13857.1/17,Ank_5/PF13857.1/0.0002,Ank/PF00023.25/0.019,Ank/PF00023.25/3.6,Ank/PF00023.25/2e+02,Ank_3/PF13606.1/0.043,Ank_3/PF13606.1/17,Ank_3/PF13606.1/92 TRINITY_DN2866_c0_g1_i2:288-2513(-)
MDSFAKIHAVLLQVTNDLGQGMAAEQNLKYLITNLGKKPAKSIESIAIMGEVANKLFSGDLSPIVNMITKKFPNCYEPTFGANCLHFAALSGRIDIIYLLWRFGMDLCARTVDFFGRSALHYAAMRPNNQQVCRFLATRLSLDQNDSHGNTPVQLAIRLGNGSNFSFRPALTLKTHSDAQRIEPVSEFPLLQPLSLAVSGDAVKAEVLQLIKTSGLREHLINGDLASRYLFPPHFGLVRVFSPFGRFTRMLDFYLSPFRPDRRKEIMDAAACLSPSWRDLHSKLIEEATRSHHNIPQFEEFKDNLRVFSHGLLEHLEWINTIVIGGSVTAALTIVPASWKGTKKDYYEHTYGNSDIDLYMWGVKDYKPRILTVYWAICKAVPDPAQVAVIQTPNTVSFVCGYPYPTVQIVLGEFYSPSHIIGSTDLDCTAVGYDGTDIWMAPRAVLAYHTRCNFTDPEHKYRVRGCPGYESRLAKYASRGFLPVDTTLSQDALPKTCSDISAMWDSIVVEAKSASRFIPSPSGTCKHKDAWKNLSLKTSHDANCLIGRSLSNGVTSDRIWCENCDFHAIPGALGVFVFSAEQYCLRYCTDEQEQQHIQSNSENNPQNVNQAQNQSTASAAVTGGNEDDSGEDLGDDDEAMIPFGPGWTAEKICKRVDGRRECFSFSYCGSHDAMFQVLHKANSPSDFATALDSATIESFKEPRMNVDLSLWHKHLTTPTSTAMDTSTDNPAHSCGAGLPRK